MDQLPPSSRPSGRWSARPKRLVTRWLYGLALAPVLTSIIETGGRPKSPREWFTEMVVGLLIAALVRQVRKEHLAVLELSRSDALTGLGNRRAFTDALEDECARVRRSFKPLALIYIDLDHFKQVNDRFGHTLGNEVLRAAADVMRGVFRANDVVARYGGEEFLVLLPDTPLAEAAVLAERLRVALEHHEWSELHVQLAITISLGVAELAARAPEEGVDEADRRLYAAKRAGRNCVVAEG